MERPIRIATGMHGLPSSSEYKFLNPFSGIAGSMSLLNTGAYEACSFFCNFSSR
jgi:hypothetical protein